MTGLLTAAELLPPGRPTELVQGRVRVLCSLTEDLLEVSRLDAGADRLELSVVPLGSVVARMVAAAGAPTELLVDTDAEVTTDVRRLDRIVSNLVANAHRHGGAPVLVRVDGATLTVRDHGPGFPEAVLSEGPQRFRTGARERGTATASASPSPRATPRRSASPCGCATTRPAARSPSCGCRPADRSPSECTGDTGPGSVRSSESVLQSLLWHTDAPPPYRPGWTPSA
ncbi:sensor histidine kinase [Kitasatospora gansuensis]